MPFRLRPKHGKVVVVPGKDLYADIQVRDTGYGITERNWENLRTLFHDQTGKNGTGLGLYITKK